MPTRLHLCPECQSEVIPGAVCPACGAPASAGTGSVPEEDASTRTFSDPECTGPYRPVAEEQTFPRPGPEGYEILGELVLQR